MELQRTISFARNAMCIGGEVEVLVDHLIKHDPEHVAVGRTAGQAIDVDGVTHLTGLDVCAPGDFVRARVVDAHDYDLVAEIVEPSSALLSS